MNETKNAKKNAGKRTSAAMVLLLVGVSLVAVTAMTPTASAAYGAGCSPVGIGGRCHVEAGGTHIGQGVRCWQDPGETIGILCAPYVY